MAGAEARQLDDLRWLGLDWDEGPDVGGPRGTLSPVGAWRPLRGRARTHSPGADLLYRCDCSRAEIARVASAPHPGDDGPRYPGTCRELGMRERRWKRPPAIRLRVPAGEVIVDDVLQGDRPPGCGGRGRRLRAASG